VASRLCPACGENHQAKLKRLDGLREMAAMRGRRKAKLLCSECGGPRDTGGARCRRCLIRLRIDHAAHKARKKAKALLNQHVWTDPTKILSDT